MQLLDTDSSPLLTEFPKLQWEIYYDGAGFVANADILPKILCVEVQCRNFRSRAFVMHSNGEIIVSTSNSMGVSLQDCLAETRSLLETLQASITKAI